jgi:hypothetical protein
MPLMALLIILLSLSLLTIRLPALSGSPAAPANSGTFVKACGLSLCLAGRLWHMYHASTYGGLQHPDLTTSLAVQGHLNTIRIDDFLDSSGAPSAAFDEEDWRKVDRMIASARSKGLHVLLDLSVYRNLSDQNRAANPYLVDWKPFLTFVTRRLNTVTRVRYADDPTIALVSLAGEVAPPHGSGNDLHVTTQQINTFFARTSAEFKALDAHHLLSPGGQYQLNWNSGIDWKTIFSLPGIDVCAVHAPPDGDDPVLAATYCKGIHKPWVWEEFSQAQEIGDRVRATYYQAVYDKAHQYGAAGVGFWNLGPGTRPYSSDVNPNTPLTWHVVVKNAPPALSRATGAPHDQRPRKANPARHGHDNRHGQHDSTRPYRLSDTFARADQVGWGITSGPKGTPTVAWGMDGDGAKAFVTISSHTGSYGYPGSINVVGIASAGSLTHNGGDALVKLKVSAVGHVTPYVVQNACSDKSCYYGARLHTSQHSLELAKRSHDWTAILASVPFMPRAHTFYWMRLHIMPGTSDTIRAKVWPAGAPEPASWMVTAVDSSPLAANLAGTGGSWDLPGNGESIRYVCYSYATSGLAARCRT